MKTIWKFEVKEKVLAPMGAKWLTAHEQGDMIYAWAEVDPTKPLREYEFVSVGTGDGIHLVPRRYLGTAFMFVGSYVQHIYVKDE